MDKIKKVTSILIIVFILLSLNICLFKISAFAEESTDSTKESENSKDTPTNPSLESDSSD